MDDECLSVPAEYSPALGQECDVQADEACVADNRAYQCERVLHFARRLIDYSSVIGTRREGTGEVDGTECGTM